MDSGDFNYLVEKPAELFWAGKNIKKNDITVDFHNHGNLFEVLYTGNCSGETEDDEGLYRFVPDSLVIHNKYSNHRETYRVEHGFSDIYYCNFSELKLKDREDLSLCDRQTVVLPLDKGVAKTTKRLFADIFDESRRKKLFANKMLDCLCNELLLIILREMISHKLLDDFSYTHSELSHKIKKEIDEHYTNPEFSLSSLAKKHFISQPYLTKIFKRDFLYNPFDYISQKRVKLAINLLLNTDDTIDNISLKVGYNNSLQLIQLFKKRFGKTPTEYRRQTTVYHYE